jgi:hypothetical protein
MDSIVAVRPARDHLTYQHTISGKFDQGSGNFDRRKWSAEDAAPG